MGLVNILTTICKTNASRLAEIVSFSNEIGAGKAVFNCAIPAVSAEDVSADQSLDPLFLARRVESLFQEVKELGLSFNLNATFPLCLLNQEVLEEMLRLGWLSVGCQMYRGRGVAFDPEGNILPCTHFSEAPLIERTIDQEGRFFVKG